MHMGYLRRMAGARLTQFRMSFLLSVVTAQIVACGGGRDGQDKSKPDRGSADSGSSKQSDASAKPDSVTDAGTAAGAGKDAGPDAGKAKPDAILDGAAPEDVADAAAREVLVMLPQGSREVDGVVNLVDGPAADQLERHILERRTG
jgi:hypothetical protein